MKNVIRLGDATTHGGKVISCRASHFTIDGIRVATVGDLCTCPVRGHHDCTITSGSPHHKLDGVPIAFEGDSVSCGARLIARHDNFRQG